MGDSRSAMALAERLALAEIAEKRILSAWSWVLRGWLEHDVEPY
jgi:hypothetical protein